MGNCIYCKKPAGIFRSKHEECSAIHQTGLQKIQDLITIRLSNGTELESLQAEVATEAQKYFIEPTEIRRVLIEEWEIAVDEFINGTNIGDDYEKKLISFKEKLNLSEQDLDKHGAYAKFDKFLVLRELMKGNIPKFINLDFALPINFQKNEQVIWAFQNVSYLEDKTRVQFVGRSHGLSIRIMKGVYYRTNAFQGNPVTHTERIHIDDGVFAITTKNIYFAGRHKALRIPYNKIVSYIPYSDGIGILRDAATAKPQVFVTGDGWFTRNLIENVAHLEIHIEPNN